MSHTNLKISLMATCLVTALFFSVHAQNQKHVDPSPRPVSVSAWVSFDADANPHVIRLSAETVTSLVFKDITGAPWNVLKVVAGAKGVLDINENSANEKSHIVTISPRKDFVKTNLAIFLEGATAPVVMAVVANQTSVDFRVNVGVNARGPGAVMPVIHSSLSDSASPELISMLAGITPEKYKQLKVVSSDVSNVKAWTFGNRMYVHTKANIMTPAVPTGGNMVTGSDGMKVYELPLSPEVRLLSNGVIGRLQLTGFLPPTFNSMSLKTQTMSK